jgi:hypothetical protein
MIEKKARENKGRKRKRRKKLLNKRKITGRTGEKYIDRDRGEEDKKKKEAEE